jgi:hypothetical protein
MVHQIRIAVMPIIAECKTKPTFYHVGGLHPPGTDMNTEVEDPAGRIGDSIGSELRLQSGLC